MIRSLCRLTIAIVLLSALPVAAQRLQSEVPHDTAIPPASMMVITGCEAKDQDGSALPRAVSAEGDAVRCAATLSGIPYVMLVSEDGALTIYQVEDAAHSSGHAGIMALAVQNATHTTALSGADGDYTPLAVDSTGKLGIRGTFAEDAGHVSGDLGVQLLTVRQDTAAALAGIDADYQPLITDGSGRLHVNVGTFPDNEPFNLAQWGGSVVTAPVAAGDAVANPIAPQMLAHLMVWSSTDGDWARQATPNGASNSPGANIAAVGIQAQLDDTSPGTITEDNYGNLRMSSRRALHTEAAGTQITLQASQVAAIVNGTTTRTTTTELGSFRDLAILINITGGGVATGTLQLFLQDSQDGGTTWDDLAASNTFTFGAATITQRFFISGRIATTATQGSAAAAEALVAGTVRNGPWGERIRVREVISGIAGTPTGPTYTISAVAK